MKFLAVVILIFQALTCFAQSGNFLLSQFSPNKDRLDNVCFQIAQHDNGIIYFATRSGLLSFDGRSWEVIEGNGAIYTIQISPDGKIYWGGANGYGVVTKDDNDLLQVNVLSDKVKDVFQSILSNDRVYFLSEKAIHIFDTKTKTATVLPSDELMGEFTGVFQLNASVYVNTSLNKIFRIDGDKLSIPKKQFFSNQQIVFTSKFKKQELVGLSTNDLYLLEEGKSPKRLKLEDQQYLNQSVIVSGAWVNDNLIVLGTLRGGVLFINLANGKTHEKISYSTGLPDNEIFAVFTDRDRSVWAAHEYGFTRITPHLPFRSFSHYPGLQGNLLCAISFENSVYVGTSLGLFKLEKEDVFEDRLIEETVSNNDVAKKTGDPAENNVPPPQQKASERRKGFLGIFRKKEEQKPQDITANPIEPNKKKRNRRTVLRTEKILIASTYRYRKVKNAEAKVTQLLSYNGKLLACGLGGMFEVSGLHAKVLVAEPIRYMYGSRHGILFTSSYSDEVLTFRQAQGGWKELDLLKNFHDQVNHIFEDRGNNVWLCALDNIYHLKLNDKEIQGLEILEMKNPNYDEFVGIALNGECVVANANGFFAYDSNEKKFRLIDSLSTESLTTYFARNESIWYRQSHGWNLLGNEYETNDLGLLNLFKKIRFINADAKSDDLWLITSNNELFKYYPDRVTIHQNSNPLLLKSIRNGDLKYGPRSVLDIDQDNSRLTFEVVQPDFVASDAIEYRYHIKGLDGDWTEWSTTNNIIEIPYLPAGEYSLKVEAKDIFGKESRLDEIFLNVLPPYWKRPWFYALEVLIFSLLVILSFRLSTRYRIISRLLMLLTIIMLIQFVETIIGKTFETTTSPVIDFLIQVVIAMLILPVEGYLTQLMLRSLDTSNRFYRFIAPRSNVQDNGKTDS